MHHCGRLVFFCQFFYQVVAQFHTTRFTPRMPMECRSFGVWGFEKVAVYCSLMAGRL
jgi:hypothetical protein